MRSTHIENRVGLSVERGELVNVPERAERLLLLSRRAEHPSTAEAGEIDPLVEVLEVRVERRRPCQVNRIEHRGVGVLDVPDVEAEAAETFEVVEHLPRHPAERPIREGRRARRFGPATTLEGVPSSVVSCGAVGRQQRGGRFVGGDQADAPVLDEGDLIAVLDRGEAMRDVITVLPSMRRSIAARIDRFGCHVDRAGRLVHHEYRCIAEQRARERDALTLAAREPQAPFAHQGVVSVGKALDEIVDTRRRRLAASISSNEASGRAYATFSAIEVENKTGSWSTMENCRRRSATRKSRMSTPSRRIAPFCTS